jgi:ligand-binding SRPBCC domain-containing protein
MTSLTTQSSTSGRAAIRIGPSPDGTGSELRTTMLLSLPRVRVFEFFSDAHNLEAITPPWLHFTVQTPRPICMTKGALIDYRLRLHRIPIRWQSRISVWEPPYRFVDEQVHGPYRRWHHEHVFEEVDGGTLCRDIVQYDVPGGRVIDALFVRRDLEKIFLFRQRKLAELFAGNVAALHGFE